MQRGIEGGSRLPAARNFRHFCQVNFTAIFYMVGQDPICWHVYHAASGDQPLRSGKRSRRACAAALNGYVPGFDSEDRAYPSAATVVDMAGFL